jgi:methionine synthase II (cobalamin-independent)
VLENKPGRASAVGSWPGSDVVEAARIAFGELSDPGVPYLPELPARGPGGDLLGRGAVLMVDTPVDLQPSGWRLVNRPGRDLERAQAMLRQDLDVLAEIADGYRGPVKIQVAGPWTLAAGLYLPRLERAVVDPGACRHLVGALTEGLALHVGEVRRLVPGAEVVVQVDEPGIGAVLSGELPTASGFGRLRAVEEQVVVEGLSTVLTAATGAGAVETLVHCCGDAPAVETLWRSGADGLSLDVDRLGVPGWEALAPALENGRRLWAGAVSTSAPGRSAASVADRVWTPWRRLGLDVRLVEAVVVTPSCGLAGLSPADARLAVARSVAAAKELAVRAEG